MLMLLWAVSAALLVLVGFGAVAFVTLLERKLLGLTQTRLGPNKVTLMGLLQPLADGVKLLAKKLIVLSNSQFMLMLASPVILLVIFMLTWSLIAPWSGSLTQMKYVSLCLFSFLGLGAYGVMMSGWSVNSAFSKLGALRGMLQSLSFEVALILVFLFPLILSKSFMINSWFLNVEMLLVWGVVWSVIALMESNRAPFDLLEGESELISGFNVEMGSSLFVLLFLSEYGMLVILAVFADVMLMGSISLISLMFIGGFLAIRSCYPRLRYDSLMGFMWQAILPLSIIMFINVFFLY